MQNPAISCHPPAHLQQGTKVRRDNILAPRLIEEGKCVQA